jgi:hypothetical protein
MHLIWDHSGNNVIYYCSTYQLLKTIISFQLIELEKARTNSHSYSSLHNQALNQSLIRNFYAVVLRQNSVNGN